MDWREFQDAYPMEKKEKMEFITPKEEFIPLIPFIPPSSDSEKSIQELDVSDLKTKKTPNLDLLTEVELEAFNGWYATCRKPKFGMLHEEATLTAWGLLIESMAIMHKDGRGRYVSEKFEKEKDDE